MTGPQLSVAFFFQMFFILAVCRVVGALARRIGHPQVVGEMIAGVLMGPSLFGLLWPTAQKVIFPPESLKVLFVGAQLGIGLYMFLVGVEFKTELFRSRIRFLECLCPSFSERRSRRGSLRYRDYFRKR